MSENERTTKNGACLAVIRGRNGKMVYRKCAHLDECRQAIEKEKPDKWECPGFVADADPLGDAFWEERFWKGEQENAE